jgi:hypothetical protein
MHGSGRKHVTIESGRRHNLVYHFERINAFYSQLERLLPHTIFEYNTSLFLEDFRFSHILRLRFRTLSRAINDPSPATIDR